MLLLTTHALGSAMSATRASARDSISRFWWLFGTSRTAASAAFSIFAKYSTRTISTHSPAVRFAIVDCQPSFVIRATYLFRLLIFRETIAGRTTYNCGYPPRSHTRATASSFPRGMSMIVIDCTRSLTVWSVEERSRRSEFATT